MYASFVNSAINIFDTLAAFYERIDISSSTSSRESSTSPASPKMAADSDYVSENNERPDASMSSAFRVEHAAPANNYLTKNHTTQNEIARESINDQRIPVTGFQLSIIFNVALFIYVLDMKLRLSSSPSSLPLWQFSVSLKARPLTSPVSDSSRLRLLPRFTRGR
jgi:hypothetical protein